MNNIATSHACAARSLSHFVEIHPSAAGAQGIKDGDWIFLETANGRVKLQSEIQ